ncbi:MAG TPA: prolipoprotein diacylglyceryl transferase family protein [Polyangiaceae bacterium]|nr:prolipoprotein diacylglyceryl transferase family protein [Polyangiaceae bacterium]
MIPYIRVHELHVGPLPIHPFGVLVAVGVLVGIELTKKRGRQLGLPQEQLASFIAWMLVAGFVGGHVLDAIFYHPQEVLAAPWTLLYLWAGLSSFGGFAGGLLGVTLWKFFELKPWVDLGPIKLARPMRRAAPVAILPYCDAVLSVFPVAWVFGRLGCTVVHDHPGILAPPSMPLAVAYGPGPVVSYGWFDLRFGAVPRYDLGLLEMLFAFSVAVAFAATWRKRFPVGWHAAVLCVVYAPVRFALDFLRLDDPQGGDLRYAMLTPAQWACLALLLGGLPLVSRVVRRPSS